MIDNLYFCAILKQRSISMKTNILRLQELAERGVITHNGHFHADDVFSAALLKITGIIPDVHIIKRVDFVPENFDGLMFDIGQKEFDHHQQNAKSRSNSCKYASFGLLWKTIGCEYVMETYGCTKKDAKKTVARHDKNFTTAMDLTDNFGMITYPNPLSMLIAARNNGNFTPDERNEIFYKVANDFCEYLQCMIKTEYEFVRHQHRANELATQNPSGFIILDKEFIPRTAFYKTTVQYIIYFCDRQTYNVTSIPPYKIPYAMAIKMSGCVQAWDTGAAFNTLENAQYATEQFIRNNCSNNLHT